MTEWILKYWLQVIFGGILTLIAWTVKKLSKKMNEQEAIKMGVQALLRDRIIQAYNVYMERGYCPIYGRENLTELAKQYENLGGNGVVPQLMEKIQCLPTDSPDGDRLEGCK